MELKYANIDLENATNDEIKAEIKRLKYLSNEYKNEEQGVKLSINGIYGSIGNKWLVFFNMDVAEAITKQGKDIILFAEKVVNAYFNKFWHLDTELHEKLGIKGEVKKIEHPVNIYSDTDSCYVSFEHVVQSCDWQSVFNSEIDFILAINEHRLFEYLNKQFDIYAKKWNTENYQVFELENISESGIWQSKKKYGLNKRWEGGIYIESLKEIVYKGIELAQSSTSSFARTKLDALMKYIFTKKKDLDKRVFTEMLRELKDEYKLCEPDAISSGSGITDYNKYVLNDTTDFELASKTPVHVRAAGYHNFLLNKNAKLKQKYQMIRGGDKVKYYYVKTKYMNENDVFAYIPNQYPYEFAPPIDYDVMFQKNILVPINRIMKVINLGEIPPGLQIINNLF